jgi:hypothetical protein
MPLIPCIPSPLARLESRLSYVLSSQVHFTPTLRLPRWVPQGRSAHAPATCTSGIGSGIASRSCDWARVTVRMGRLLLDLMLQLQDVRPVSRAAATPHRCTPFPSFCTNLRSSYFTYITILTILSCYHPFFLFPSFHSHHRPPSLSTRGLQSFAPSAPRGCRGSPGPGSSWSRPRTPRFTFRCSVACAGISAPRVCLHLHLKCTWQAFSDLRMDQFAPAIPRPCVIVKHAQDQTVCS